MKHQAIVGNIGHFDNEIDMAGLARTPGVRRNTIKPQVDEWVFADGHSIIVLSEGRLLNLGNATGHPSFVMSNSFANQTIAQIELFTKTDEYDKQVYVLPKHLDEKVARLHLDALGVRADQAVQGPGRVHRRRRGRPVQAGPLPLLTDRRTALQPVDTRRRRPHRGRRRLSSRGGCVSAGRLPSSPRTMPVAMSRSLRLSRCEALLSRSKASSWLMPWVAIRMPTAAPISRLVAMPSSSWSARCGLPRAGQRDRRERREDRRGRQRLVVEARRGGRRRR